MRRGGWYILGVMLLLSLFWPWVLLFFALGTVVAVATAIANRKGR